MSSGFWHSTSKLHSVHLRTQRLQNTVVLFDLCYGGQSATGTSRVPFWAPSFLTLIPYSKLNEKMASVSD